ncbi:MAG TPA: 1-acyl-sn-glycerol-3-phosphate acyltransferase [Chitinophagales bacterium]|nr:1-acyl-sn-glycerol-3-phosphate acyltransferase [Chitinophagales bacterium]
MIYTTIKGIVKISLSVFFKKIVVTGSENIPDHGPMIIVANHPNTFMDPLIIGTITEQRIGFVANAGIFSNKLLITVLRYFHVIPIFRKKDIAPGEKPDNKEAFIKCHEYLDQSGTLLIFPEGSSYYELKLREIKTGTARIALSFEELKKFQGNLKILPVALDYSDSLQFRSMVSITVNPPLYTHVYKEAYLRNEFDGVKALTEDIRKALAKNIPRTSGKEQEDFLIKAHKFYTAFYEPGADLYENPKRSLELRTQLSKVFHYIYVHDTGLYHDTETKVHAFFSGLKSEGLTAGFFTDQFLRTNKALVCLGYLSKLLLLLPFYLFGILTNYLPYILPSKIFQSLKIDIEYKTSVQMVSGMITFPLFYALEIWIFRHYVSADLRSTLLFMVALPVTGYITMYYWTELQRFARVIRFCFFMKPREKVKLRELRDEILDRMEEARKSLS